MTVVLDSKRRTRSAGIAHLGYFRQELVTRRRWIGEQAYGEIVAQCQFGPARPPARPFPSGLWRAGLLGALAGWLGFTLPSALIMLAVAYGSARLHGELAKAAIHGLKLVAIVVVAQAVWGMAQALTPNWRRRGIALAAGLVLALVGGAVGQIAAILIGAAGGLVLCRALPASPATGLAMAVRGEWG